MNRTGFARRIMKRIPGLTITECKMLTDMFFEEVIAGLEKDGIVDIYGLLRIIITEKANHNCMNYYTGERFDTGLRQKIVVAPKKKLKKRLDNNEFKTYIQKKRPWAHHGGRRKSK